MAATSGSISRPWTIALVHQAALVVVFSERRLARHEHEEKSAARIGERNSRIQRDVQVTIGLVPGLPQLPNRSQRRTVEGVLGHQPAGFRMAHEQRAAGEGERADAVERQRSQHDAGGAAARQDEAARTNAGGIEDLDPLAAIRRVGDGKAAVDGDVKCARLDQPAVFRSNLNELARGGA